LNFGRPEESSSLIGPWHISAESSLLSDGRRAGGRAGGGRQKGRASRQLETRDHQGLQLTSRSGEPLQQGVCRQSENSWAFS
jgi:hypothetical protein